MRCFGALSSLLDPILAGSSSYGVRPAATLGVELVTAAARASDGFRIIDRTETVVEFQTEPLGAAHRPLHPDWRCEACRFEFAKT